MLALLLSCALGLTGLRAQTNTEYSFRQQSVADGQGYNSNGDPVPVLTMDCLAANGYGQWTLSSGNIGDNTYPPGWYLLANGLYAPSTHYDPNNTAAYPGCIPPGVVQNGCIAGAPCGIPAVAEPKATANLDGAVSYVWPDPTRQTFDVQGFRQPDVDLSLSFLANPEPPMNIVGPQYTTNVPTNTYANILTGTPTNDVTTTAPYQDEFDVCSDAAYLYIAWCSTKTNTLGQIYYEVLDINTLAPVAGPALVGTGMRPTVACDPRNNRNGGVSPKFELAYIAPVLQLGTYVYVGIAPDDGGNLSWETYFSGTFTPHAIAPSFLDPTNAMNPPIGYGFVAHARALVSSVQATGAWNAACYAIVDYAGFSLILYNASDLKIPTGQAAFVDGSLISPPLPIGLIPPPPPPPPPALPIAGWPVKNAPIVAFANPYDNQDVSTDAPPNWRGYDQFHCLYQIDLSRNPGQPPNQSYPLVIVRNSDNGEVNPTQPNPSGSTTDTRLVLNQVETTPPPPQPQLLTDPVSYCAAVNQMGIHVHWRTPEGVHYYARDMSRTFDEAIDENTLVTDQCTVSDGSASGTNHGGTPGATIPNGLRMTVWTDPNYGPPGEVGTIHYGLYSPVKPSVTSPYVGTLNFAASANSDNVTLNVGAPIWSPGYIIPATFAVMPYFSINFGPPPQPDFQQGITVNANSIFDYYGRIAAPDPNGILQFGSPFHGLASLSVDQIKLLGIEQSGITNFAYLNIHPGSEFYVPNTSTDNMTFNSDYGSINVMYGSSIFPTTSGSPNPDATGHMTWNGNTRLANGEVVGNIPRLSNYVDNFGITHVPSRQEIIGVGSNSQNVAYEFDASSVNFRNSEPEATSEIRIGFPLNSTNVSPFSNGGSSGFEECNFSAMEVHVIDPMYPNMPTSYLQFYIQSCQFNNIRNNAILIENDQDPTQSSYGNIVIEYNHFNNFAIPSVGSGDGITPCEAGSSDGCDECFNDDNYSDNGEELHCGIYLRNLDGNDDPSNTTYTVPLITGNYFTYNNGFYPEVNYNANNDWNSSLKHTSGAITLENSTAMVTGNTITDNGYPVGISIFNSSFENGTPPRSYSVICNNTISGITDCEIEGIFDGYGIMSSGLHGIISSNTITNNDVGIELFDDNNPGIVYNTITGNREIGLEVQPGFSNKPSIADLSSAAAGQTSSSVGAFNKITGEAEETNEPEQADPISIVSGGNLLLQDGMNDIEISPANAQTGYYNWLIFSTGTAWLGYVNATQTSIDHNFWGTDVIPTPCTGYPTTACNQNWGSNIIIHDSYWSSTGATVSQSATQVPSDASCPANAPSARARKSRIITPQSGTYDTSRCSDLGSKVYYYNNHHQWQQLYDTAKALVENCYNNILAMDDIAGDLSSAVQQLYYTDTSIYLEYRHWLESILYLNTTDPEYFCIFAYELAGTTHINNDTSEQQSWKAMNRGFAILEWIIHNTSCDSSHGIEGEILTARRTQDEQWLNDTLIPLDTSIPPLDSVEPGLTALLDKHFLYADVPDNFHGILSSVSASPNPLNEGTIISFGISKEAYVKIEVFDVIGNRVSSAGFEKLFEPGNKEVPISLQGLPSGTYFARIVTAYGEVQTVKLVKE